VPAAKHSMRADAHKWELMGDSQLLYLWPQCVLQEVVLCRRLWKYTHTHTVTKNKVVIMKNEQTPSDIFFKRFIFSFSNRYTAEQFTQNCLEQQQFYLQFSMAVSFTTWCKSNLALFVQAWNNIVSFRHTDTYATHAPIEMEWRLGFFFFLIHPWFAVLF